MAESKKVKVSVRNLVEFILRSGDIDNSQVSRADADAMQAGSKLHRKLQKQMGAFYTAEVPLSIELPLEEEGLSFSLCVEGRADGIIDYEASALKIMFEPENALLLFNQTLETIIEEIKGTYLDVHYIEEPMEVHLAQAKCYAYIYARDHKQSIIGIRVTYGNLETEEIKQFDYVFDYNELEKWFLAVVKLYQRWASFSLRWSETRDTSIQNLCFPFPYREGQKELVKGVYQTILRKKMLFIEAPTGVGKTISTVYPSIRALGEGTISKIFYLTAKTITRTVASDTIKILSGKGMKLKALTITAKEKVCILDKPDCNPVSCERAKGHYDRVNDAVYDLLISEDEVNKELVEKYADKYCVCPFEMSLDLSLWVDAIICDYNYAFDPNVYLRRFFAGDKSNDYCFLVDEAHNLVDRAREMYSACLYQESFSEVKQYFPDKNAKVYKQLLASIRAFQKKRDLSEEFTVHDTVGDIVLVLMRFLSELDLYLKEHSHLPGHEELLTLYMETRNFLNIHELVDEKYCIYSDCDEENRYIVKLQCMDPSKVLKTYLSKGRASVMFSATLLPITYYMEQLGGNTDDYAMYAQSSFHVENRKLLIGTDVSTKYSRRNATEYKKIADYIISFVNAKTGNYIVFFPSYQMMEEIETIVEEKFEGILLMQNRSMTEEDREAFLAEFVEEPTISVLGFCVMGGIFGEGIDLKSSRLIGAIIVGTGLPMVCNERELFREYYQEVKQAGFEYAYLYPAMNKVLQSAGRVIRTIEDRGAILLLDERFNQKQYLQLFPREWFPYDIVNVGTMKDQLNKFWCE